MAPLSESSLGSYPVVCHRPEISVHCERIDPSSAARLGIERKMKSSGLRPKKRLPRAPRGQSASVPSLRYEIRGKTASKSMWPRSRKRRKECSGADLAFLWVSNIELRLVKKLTAQNGDLFSKRDWRHTFSLFSMKSVTARDLRSPGRSTCLRFLVLAHLLILAVGWTRAPYNDQRNITAEAGSAIIPPSAQEGPLGRPIPALPWV